MEITPNQPMKQSPQSPKLQLKMDQKRKKSKRNQVKPLHKSPFIKRNAIFDLKNLNLGDDDLVKFFEIHKIPEGTKALDLSHNKLTSKSIDMILDNLPQSINIVRIEDNPDFTLEDKADLMRGIVLLQHYSNNQSTKKAA